MDKTGELCYFGLPTGQGACQEDLNFLQQYTPPVIIDEIQYAPELLPYIKIRVDENPEKGQYFLTRLPDVSYDEKCK